MNRKILVLDQVSWKLTVNGGEHEKGLLEYFLGKYTCKEVRKAGLGRGRR